MTFCYCGRKLNIGRKLQIFAKCVAQLSMSRFTRTIGHQTGMAGFSHFLSQKILYFHRDNIMYSSNNFLFLGTQDDYISQFSFKLNCVYMIQDWPMDTDRSDVRTSGLNFIRHTTPVFSTLDIAIWKLFFQISQLQVEEGYLIHIGLYVSEI